MIIINEDQLIEAIEGINGMTPKKFEKFFHDFSERQPNVVGYLMACADNIKNEDARDEFVYICSVIWHCYDKLKLPMAKIGEKELEKKEKEQIKAWEKLAAITDPKEEKKYTRKFLTQPQLWQFMNEIITPDEKHPDQTNFDNEDDIAMTYACVNLLIELLNDKVNKGPEKN
jgi:hypothetical protein